MGLQTAVVLGPLVPDSLYGCLRVVHPRADDGKINCGITILDISSFVSTLGSVFESRPIDECKLYAFGFDSKCTFLKYNDGFINEFIFLSAEFG